MDFGLKKFNLFLQSAKLQAFKDIYTYGYEYKQRRRLQPEPTAIDKCIAFRHYEQIVKMLFTIHHNIR